MRKVIRDTGSCVYFEYANGGFKSMSAHTLNGAGGYEAISGIYISGPQLSGWKNPEITNDLGDFHRIPGKDWEFFREVAAALGKPVPEGFPLESRRMAERFSHLCKIADGGGTWE